CRVAAFGQDDAQRLAAPILVVELLELRPKSYCVNAHDSVQPRIESLVPVEDLDSDFVFLDGPAWTIERVLDAVAKEAAEPGRAGNLPRRQNAIEVIADCL